MKANPSGCSQFGEPLKSCVVYAFTFGDHCHEKHFHQTIENLYLFPLRMIYKNCETNPRKIHEILPNKSPPNSPSFSSIKRKISKN